MNGLTYSSYSAQSYSNYKKPILTIAKLDSGVQDGHQQQWTSEKKKEYL